MGNIGFAGGKVGMKAPVSGIVLSEIALGSIVKINENGSPVEFYVAAHDYKSSLNGAGRTLLVRKDAHSARVWDADQNMDYSASDIDTWLNGTYKSLLPTDVQSAVAATSFNIYQTVSGKNEITISRAVFLLGAREILSTANRGPADDTVLMGGALNPVYYNGSTVIQWTRSVYHTTTSSKFITLIYPDGQWMGQGSTGSFYARPCFTLPSTARFDTETLLFKEAV